MGRIGFWQLLLDDKVSYWEAQKINQAQDAADIAANEAAVAQYSIASAQNRIDAMSREIVMLRTAITVLTQTLKDTKVVDDRLLDARLQAAMEEAFPKPAPAAQPIPAADRKVVCIKCRGSVPAASTVMTAEGPICDRCPPT